MSPELARMVARKKRDGHIEDRRRVPRPSLSSLCDINDFTSKVPKAIKTIDLVRIHQANLKDLPELLRIEEIAWPEEARASREMLASRIEVFPEGVLCGTSNGSPVGFVCLERVAETPREIRGDWATLTDNGFIRKTHAASGPTLFGVSLSVVPHAPRDTVFALCEAAARFVIRKELSWLAFGSRMPRFHRFAEKMDVKTYIRQFKNGRHLDPELDLYKRLGLSPVHVLPNFFPDPASCDFGLLLAWKNPFKELPDQLNLWELYRLFSFLEFKLPWRREPWKI